MNPWQVPGDVPPGLGRILERVHGRHVWSYRPLSQQSAILPSLIIAPDIGPANYFDLGG